MKDEPSVTLSESDVYALLGHYRRRLVLRILQDFATPLSIAKLAELVADCENETSTADDLQIAVLSLHHCHLPRLHEAEVVRYDHERGTVQTGRNFGVLVGTIAETDGSEDGQFAD